MLKSMTISKFHNNYNYFLIALSSWREDLKAPQSVKVIFYKAETKLRTFKTLGHHLDAAFGLYKLQPKVLEICYFE